MLSYVFVLQTGICGAFFYLVLYLHCNLHKNYCKHKFFTSIILSYLDIGINDNSYIDKYDNYHLYLLSYSKTLFYRGNILFKRTNYHIVIFSFYHIYILSFMII